MKKRIFVVTTVSSTMSVLLKGQLESLTKSGFEVVALCNHDNKIYTDRLHQIRDVKFLHLKLLRKVSLLYDIMALCLLIYYSIKYKPAIIYTITPKANLLGQCASALTARIGIAGVWGLPKYDLTSMSGKFLRLADTIGYKASTRVVPIIPSLGEFLVSHNFTTRSKIDIIHYGSGNGVDLEYYDPAISVISNATPQSIHVRSLQESQSEGYINLLFVGRVVRDKGISHLANLIHKNFLGLKCKLFIVGPYKIGPDLTKEELSSLSSENVTMIGRIDDLRPYYSLSDLLIFPSKREGLPFTLLEALAMNLPVLASNIIGNKDLVNIGNGDLFTYGDQSDFEQKFQNMYNRVVQGKFIESRGPIIDRYEQKNFHSKLADYLHAL